MFSRHARMKGSFSSAQLVSWYRSLRATTVFARSQSQCRRRYERVPSSLMRCQQQQQQTAHLHVTSMSTPRCPQPTAYRHPTQCSQCMSNYPIPATAFWVLFLVACVRSNFVQLLL